MMPGNIFLLQLVADLGDRRRVFLRIAVSVLLAMPFILIGMPAHAQATGIVMVILFTGFFGTAVAHARLRADLRFSRLKMLPISLCEIWLDLILSSVLVRLVPIMVVLFGFIIVNGHGVTILSVVAILGLLCISLMLLTILGMGIGRLARSNGEVHLFGALVCVVVAFISGVTPLPERLDWLKTAMALNPISRLLAALSKMADGSASTPRIEFLFASLVIAAVSVTALSRWISGSKFNIDKLDVQGGAVDNDKN